MSATRLGTTEATSTGGSAVPTSSGDASASSPEEAADSISIAAEIWRAVDGRLERARLVSYEAGLGRKPTAANMAYWFSYIAGAANQTERAQRHNWMVYTTVYEDMFNARIKYLSPQGDHALCTRLCSPAPR